MDGSPPMPPPPPAPAPMTRRPSIFDRVARGIALLALVIILSVIYWIPLGLLDSPFSVPIVLAVLTLVAVNMASRMHRLRQRVDELEARAPPVQK